MAWGCPCIGAPGAAEEIIDPEVSGLVVDPEDAGAVAAALVRLLDDPALARRMGDAGRARVAEHFSADRFVEDLRRIVRLAQAC
jgi:glycosyltransferase involved in cell wall biosynthesis